MNGPAPGAESGDAEPNGSLEHVDIDEDKDKDKDDEEWEFLVHETGALDDFAQAVREELREVRDSAVGMLRDWWYRGLAQHWRGESEGGGGDDGRADWPLSDWLTWHWWHRKTQ